MTDTTKDELANNAGASSLQEVPDSTSASGSGPGVGSEVAAGPALRATTENVDDKAIKRTRTVATVVLIILILLILLACALMFALLRPGGLGLPDQRAGIMWIRSIYGHGTAQQDLINPTSVVFDPDGNSLWVSDNTRFRLVQYDLNGRVQQIIYVRDLGGEAIVASYLAIAPNGWFYIAGQTYNHVNIFDDNFQHQGEVGIESPTVLAANNDMLVVGSRSGFAVFDSTGEFIGMHGNDPEDDFNQFDYVGGLAIDDNNNIFVVDTYNNRLVKYDNEGIPIYETLLGHPGNQGIDGARHLSVQEIAELYPATMQVPQGITLDGNGRAYIIDMFDFSIAVFEADTGEFIKKVGEQGTHDGSFQNPNDIAYHPGRDMFASAEAHFGRVQLFGIDGSSTDPFAALNRQFGDILRACLPPLLIILLILAAYLISRALAKKRREKEMTAALEEGSALDAAAAAGVGDTVAAEVKHE